MDGGKIDKPTVGIQRMSSAKRAILIPQKTNIRLDLESLANASASSSDARSRRPSLGKNPVVSASVSIDKVPSLSRPSSHYPGPLSARTAEDAFLPESKIAQFLEDVPSVGLTKEDSKIIRTRVIEEMYRIQQRQQISPEERQRLYQLAISMDAPKLARKLVAEGKESAEDYNMTSNGSDGEDNDVKHGQQPVSSFLTGEYHIPSSQKTPPRSQYHSISSPKGSQSQKSHHHSSHDTNISNNNNKLDDDDLFCKAFDEVERIRQRMIQRVNTATVASSAPTNNTPQSARQQQQPLTGRRLSGDNVQNDRRKSLSPKPGGISHNLFSIIHQDHSSNSNNHLHHHHHHQNTYNHNNHQHHSLPAHQSAGKIHPTLGNNDHVDALQKQQSQFLHELLTPRTPDRPSQNHTSGIVHTNSSNSKNKSSHHNNQLHPSQNQMLSFTPTISVDSEPSLNVHEALDSILGSHSHSHSHLHSQPNSRSLSSRKKSALSSYHRILAAADAHSEDSAHSSDNEREDVDYDKNSDGNDTSEGEHDAAQVVDLLSYGSISRNGKRDNIDDDDSENGEESAAIAATEDEQVYPSNHSSLDSESRRALEGLRRHDSFKNNKSQAKHTHNSHHHKSHHHNHHPQHQKVPPLQTTATTGDINDTLKPKSARLAPLLDPNGSSNDNKNTSNTNDSNINNNNNVSLKTISTLVNKRQLRGQQLPAPSASQKLPPGYLMIASPLSDWIHASSTGLITPMSQLPPLTSSHSVASLAHPPLQSANMVQPSPYLASSASSASFHLNNNTSHNQPSSVLLRPQTSLYTPSDLHTHQENDGSDRHASLRQSRFTFTPQETTSLAATSTGNNDINNNTNDNSNLQPQMAWSSLEMLNSSSMQQNPDWQNLKRSLDLLKDHMPMSSTSSTHLLAGASPLATPSHIALSGLTSPNFSQQQQQPFQRPISSSTSSSSTAATGTSSATTAHMLLQQSFRRPISSSTTTAPLTSYGSGTNSSISPRANNNLKNTNLATATGSSDGNSLKKTSSFRHAGDLLLAKNIVDAATTASSSTNNPGIAQSTLMNSALKNLTNATFNNGNNVLSQETQGMPPMLKREGTQPFQVGNFINSSSNSSVTNTPTPGSVPSSSYTVKSTLSGNNSSNNNSRMFALAAALDAGDAVGKLMADMMMLGTPTGAAGNHSSNTLRIANNGPLVNGK